MDKKTLKTLQVTSRLSRSKIDGMWILTKSNLKSSAVYKHLNSGTDYSYFSCNHYTDIFIHSFLFYFRLQQPKKSEMIILTEIKKKKDDDCFFRVFLLIRSSGGKCR